ncbi:hypothetical protein FKM82_023443 [Ascaphus truei]
MCVSVGIIVGARGFRRWEGMGSRGQVVEGEEEINSDTSSSETKGVSAGGPPAPGLQGHEESASDTPVVGGLAPGVVDEVAAVAAERAIPGLTALLATWGTGVSTAELVQLLSAVLGRTHNSYLENGEQGLSRADHHSFSKFVDGTDDLDAFLNDFEMQCSQFRIPRRDWVVRRRPLLSGKAKRTVMGIPHVDADEYGHVKSKLLTQYALTPESYRGKFRMGVVLPGESYSTYASRIALHGTQWVEGNGVTTFHTLLDLFFQEKLLQQLPTDARGWVYDRIPQTYEDAARMADEYVASRVAMKDPVAPKGVGRAAQGTKTTPPWKHQPVAANSAPKAAEFKHERRCYSCNKVGHLRPDCPDWDRSKGPHQGQCSPAARPVTRVQLAHTVEPRTAVEPAHRRMPSGETALATSGPAAESGGHQVALVGMQPNDVR